MDEIEIAIRQAILSIYFEIYRLEKMCQHNRPPPLKLVKVGFVYFS